MPDTVTVEFGEGSVRCQWEHPKDGRSMSSDKRTTVLLARTLERCPFHLFHRASQRRLGSPARTSF